MCYICYLILIFKSFIMKKVLQLVAVIFATSTAFAQTARVQIIHNSADAAAAVVDIYVNGTLLFNDVAFRTATPYFDAPAGISLSIAIAPGSSTSVAAAVGTFPLTLVSGSKYVVVADGIVSATGYLPGNTGASALGLKVYTGAREAATVATNTDILVHHGCTDAPVVDVVSGGSILVNDIGYSQFQGYLSVPTANIVLGITPGALTTVLESFNGALSTLGLLGKSVTILASGFLNTANNSTGAGFGLWAATAAGGPLVPLTNITGLNEVLAQSTTLYPVPASNELTIQSKSPISSYIVRDMAGRIVLESSNLIVSNQQTLNVSDLSSGTYTIEFSSNDATASKLFTVSK
jgi:hypothetical protein